MAKKRLNTSAKLIGAIVEQKQAEQKLKESENRLKERVKELKCLYGKSKLIEKPDKLSKKIVLTTI